MDSIILSKIKYDFMGNPIFPDDEDFAGCIILEKGDSYVAKVIHRYMNKYADQHGYPHLPYTHAETLYWDFKKQCLMTGGARIHGVESSKPSEYYLKGHERAILIPKKLLKTSEQVSLYNYFYRLDPRPYQYGSLFSWIIYIETQQMIWLGKRGDKKVVCFELAGRGSDYIEREPGCDLNKVSLYHLWFNQHYTSYRLPIL